MGQLFLLAVTSTTPYVGFLDYEILHQFLVCPRIPTYYWTRDLTKTIFKEWWMTFQRIGISTWVQPPWHDAHDDEIIHNPSSNPLSYTMKSVIVASLVASAWVDIVMIRCWCFYEASGFSLWICAVGKANFWANWESGSPPAVNELDSMMESWL